MAFVDLTAGPAQEEYSLAGAEVYARRRWSDPWTWLPFVQPVTVTEGHGGAVGSATFRYIYGPIARAEDGLDDIYNPYYLSGAYVCVWVYDAYGAADLWYGQCEVEQSMPRGGEVAAGEQRFTAYEVSHMFGRIPVIGSYTWLGFINRPIVFNRSRSAGLGLNGNRHGGVLSSRLGGTWNALQLIEYLLYFFINNDEDGNPRPIQWQLAGDLRQLEYIEQEWDLHGRYCDACLAELIPRNRGLGWRPVIFADGSAYIYVFNSFSSGIVAWDGYLAPNSLQTQIDYTGVRAFDSEISINRLAEYATVEVLGGYVYSCFTVSVADGTLVPGWSEGEETAYKAGSSKEDATAEDHDNARSAESLDYVYQRFELPYDWNFFAGDGLGGDQYNVVPGVWPLGEIDPEILAPMYGEDQSFERELPFDVVSDTPVGFTKLRPFVLVNIIAEEEDPEDPEETILVDHWWYVDKMQAGERPAASVTLGSGELVINVRPPMNHVAALGSFEAGAEGTADSNHETKYDWQNYLATVNLRTDTRLRVAGYVPGWLPGEQGRKKVIDVPGAQAWYVVPGTVTRAEDGELVHHEGGLVRDDTIALQRIAVMAAWWYAQAQNVVRCDIGWITLAHPVGYMATGIWTREGYTELGTVITQRTWQFGQGVAPQRTTIETSYAELDFVAMSGDVARAHGVPALLDGTSGGSSGVASDFQAFREQMTQLPLRPTSVGVDGIERVKVLPPLVTTGGVREVWWLTAADGGTGDGQVWETFPGATRWYPRTGLWSDKSGVPV
ncbi:MAG: hypothetical protein HYV27_15350 [Candidatus Hydrogenedentes bacterium]|nr:hypothetical protein [Candidatus Hydrogenedentota bacterium]